MEIAGLRFASNRLHFGSRAFWRENMEHLVEADRGWRYTMGEQVPESFIMSQLLGLLLPSAKTTSAGWCSWQIRCRLFEARPFFFLSLFVGVLQRKREQERIGDCVVYAWKDFQGCNANMKTSRDTVTRGISLWMFHFCLSEEILCVFPGASRWFREIIETCVLELCDFVEPQSTSPRSLSPLQISLKPCHEV